MEMETGMEMEMETGMEMEMETGMEMAIMAITSERYTRLTPL
jgi:hypothetical protein